MDEARLWVTILYRHIQGRHIQWYIIVRADGPTHYRSRVQVHQYRQIQVSLSGRNICHFTHLDPIWHCLIETSR